MSANGKDVLSGRVGYGVALALCTTLMWGFLPISLKITLTQLDPYTATWLRFVVSFVLLGGWMAWRNDLPNFREYGSSTYLWLLLACSGMMCNYIFYASSLQFLNPETAQLLIQIAPFLVLIGGVFLFKEPFSTGQRLGVLLLLTGFLVFFNKNLAALFDRHTDYGFGVFLMLLAAITWAVYALVQKRLLRKMSSMDIMLVIYLFGCVTFFPKADPSAVLSMSGLPLLMLIFCCLNTLVAYGAFAESLQHIHASQISAIITLVPIITFAAMETLLWLQPDIMPSSELNWLAYVGAVLVVLGSILAARHKTVKAIAE